MASLAGAWYGVAEMLAIDRGSDRFTYRVAGIAIRAGLILLHREQG